jgi:exonuclease V gamma subunit
MSTKNHKVTAEHSIQRVIKKRLANGASVESVRLWLEHLLAEVWTRPGATRQAIKSMLANFDKHVGAAGRVNTLLAVELENYRKGMQLAVPEYVQAEFISLTIAKIREIVEQEGV